MSPPGSSAWSVAPTLEYEDLINQTNAISFNDNLKCKKCQALFPDLSELKWHKEEMAHNMCEKCEACFCDAKSLAIHQLTDHRESQEIECPGCLVVFDAVSSWFDHIEKNRCTGIFHSDVAKRREKMLNWSNSLIRMNEANPGSQVYNAHKAYYKAEDFATPTEKPQLRNIESAWSPEEFQLREQEFPALGSGGATKNGPGQTNVKPSDKKQEQGETAWGKGKVLFPKAPKPQPTYNAVPPPSTYDPVPKAASVLSAQSTLPDSKIQYRQTSTFVVDPIDIANHYQGQIVDPNDPKFNPAVFFNSILEQFTCPYKRCNQKTKTVSAFKAHLNSQKHAGSKLTCPGCNKVFTSGASLISHVETSRKCKIRHSDHVRPALSQATGGLIDVDYRETLENGGIKLVIDHKVVKDLGDTENKALPKPEQLKENNNDWKSPPDEFRDTDWPDEDPHW
ncbi:hypothetical protein F5Y16DRAFT_398994 [Xylariaceae sp. FL0255]|nr:hypothetical protein F5Y16DRAFT_398994 [Xylariaceae sp. FL0255]